MSQVDIQEAEFSLLPALDEQIGNTLSRLKAMAQSERPRLVDTTMLFAPRSGGVKRYLQAKRTWLAANRPGVDHTLVVPGARHHIDADGIVRIAGPVLRANGGRGCRR